MKHYYCTALLSAQDAALKTNEHTTAPASSAMFKTSYFLAYVSSEDTD